MAEKSNPEDDSVTVKGLPGKPENVGKSVTRRGEEIAKKEGKGKGRVGVGKEGPSDRPAEGSTAEAMTGIDPQDPITAPNGDSDDPESSDKTKKLRRA